MTEIIEITGHWAQLQFLFFGATLGFGWFIRIVLKGITKTL